MIIDEIIKIQNGDEDSILKIIEKFKPILKKYAYRLYYEDAYEDLLIDFIELLMHHMYIDKIQNRSDGGMVSYLSKSIHNSYIKRLIQLKQLQNMKMYSDLTESELYYIDTITATQDTYTNTELDMLRNSLTDSEFNLIKMIYYDGYSVSETALAIGISRQAANQMKNRALKKLKHILGGGNDESFD